jgi:hypothetical protein
MIITTIASSMDDDHNDDCIGFTPDHTTNTANSVLPFCSEDIGIHPATTMTEDNDYDDYQCGNI